MPKETLPIINVSKCETMDFENVEYKEDDDKSKNEIGKNWKNVEVQKVLNLNTDKHNNQLLGKNQKYEDQWLVMVQKLMTAQAKAQASSFWAFGNSSSEMSVQQF